MLSEFFQGIESLQDSLSRQIVSGGILQGMVPGHEGWFFMHVGAFILAPDLMLVLNTLAHPGDFWKFALLAVFGSVIGGIVDYSLGYWGGRPIYQRLVRPELQTRTEQFCDRFGGWSLTLCSLMPVPYKPLVLSVGMFRVPVHHFLTGLFTGRMVRFFLLGALIYWFHDAFSAYLQNLTLGFTLVVLMILGIRLYLKKKTRKSPVETSITLPEPTRHAVTVKPSAMKRFLIFAPLFNLSPSPAKLFKAPLPVHPDQPNVRAFVNPFRNALRLGAARK